MFLLGICFVLGNNVVEFWWCVIIKEFGGIEMNFWVDIVLNGRRSKGRLVGWIILLFVFGGFVIYVGL